MFRFINIFIPTTVLFPAFPAFVILCSFSVYMFSLRPFASLYQLRVHTETHARQNNLKFSCSMCGASYARAFALKDHIKQVHNRDADKVDSLVSILLAVFKLFFKRC